jgi:hypothetical protein
MLQPYFEPLSLWMLQIRIYLPFSSVTTLPPLALFPFIVNRTLDQVDVTRPTEWFSSDCEDLFDC